MKLKLSGKMVVIPIEKDERDSNFTLDTIDYIDPEKGEKKNYSPFEDLPEYHESFA